jgi:ribonuclease G
VFTVIPSTLQNNLNVSNELIINVSESDISIALLDNKQLVELHKEKNNIEFTVGDIYLGKVKKVMPGLNAAFVDVGSEKDAFLHYLDLGPQVLSLNKFLKACLSKKGKAPSLQRFQNEKDIDKNGKISNVLQSGQIILVQIVKEPISTKGPRLSSEISLAGRNLVLIPFSDKVSVSQKIESAEERHRLKTLIQSIKPKNYGVIVRTVAEGKKVAVFDAELRGLVKKWESSFEQIRGSVTHKRVVSEISRTSSLLRDALNGTFANIFVNDEVAYQEIKDYIGEIAPEKEKIVRLYNGSEPIFEHFGIEKSIKTLFGRTVSVRSGAYLIIEHTEALHVIDVNSGNRSRSAKDQETNALEVNLAAVDEIARQLRLRDMGGIIVVDFIDMQSNDHKMQVFERMRGLMASQKAKHNVLPLSKFGLMQITRQRVRPEMSIDTNEKCPTCKGSGEITPSILVDHEIELAIARFIEKEKVNNIRVRVHPIMSAYLKKGFPSIRLRWMLKFKCIIKIVPATALTFLDFNIFSPSVRVE